jgi:hypothetical protein
MFSSEDRDDKVETDLKIANRTINREIKTNDEDSRDACDLGNSEKLSIASIFNAILNTYEEDSGLASFLIVMQSMLEDNIALDSDNSCKMEYLYDMMDDYLNDDLKDYDITDKHTTPNCKEYNIEYSETKKAYYSSVTRNRVYFESKDEL